MQATFGRSLAKNKCMKMLTIFDFKFNLVFEFTVQFSSVPFFK